jgi:ribosomal protein L37E
MQCEYILTGLRRCTRRASHVQVSVKSVCGEGTVTYFRRVCADHAKAGDKDIHTWTDVPKLEEKAFRRRLIAALECILRELR